MNKKANNIKLVADMVIANSAKGKVTTTKYVGTYEYKSGYDTLFAVGYDENKNIVAYSYYQNDRGEHIDTITYPLNKLTEKQLNEVAENLNTKNKDILSYIKYLCFEDRYKELLEKLGIFTPKKKPTYEIDPNKIPELENENDAYRIDRKCNVTILKFIGNVKNENTQLFLAQDGTWCEVCKNTTIRVFGCLKKAVKNNPTFFVLSGETYSQQEYGFVRNKKMLLDVVEKAKTLGTYYVVRTDNEEYLKAFKTRTISRLELKNNYEGKAEIFDTEQEAVMFRNSLISEAREKALKLLKQCNELIDNFAPQYKADYFELYKQLKTMPAKVIPGTYYQLNHCENGCTIVPIEIVKIDPTPHEECCYSHGIAFLKDGTIIEGGWAIFTKENANKLQTIYNDENWQKNKEKVENLKRGKEWLESYIKNSTIIITNIENSFTWGINFQKIEDILKENAS